MQTIAVLLTVFNRKDKTLKCLQHLFNQLPIEGYSIDVYLTDDGCTDGTPEAVKEQYPQVNIIHGDGNLFGIEECTLHGKKQLKKDTISIYG